ncbi:MAG: hypothetical protein K6E50_11550 [Lachnospiraceae bacterium]|nr:hypothetical protein [Lachnospiraceae bacterium]
MSEKEVSKTDRGREKQLRLIGCLLLAAFLLELFVFNFRTFQSLFFNETVVPADHLKFQDMTADEAGDLYLAEGQGVIYLTGLPELPGTERIRNVRLEAELPEVADRPDEAGGILTISPYIRDAGHDQYDPYAEHVFHPQIEDSHFLWLHPSDPVKTITLSLELSEGSVLRLRSITINAKRPLQISLLRFLVLFVILGVFYLLRPASFLWQDTVGMPKLRSLVCGVGLGACVLLPGILLDASNDYLKSERNFRPYQMLAEALDDGQVWLKAEVPQALMDLENPYDYTAREAAGLEVDKDYLWDTVYYDGHYYCYFGAVPCVLFYLPVWHFLGRHLNDAFLMVVLLMLIYSAIYLCCREWAKRKRPQLPEGYLLIISAMAFLGSGLMSVLGNPDPHDIPRVTGLAFVLWGLFLWMRSVKREEKGIHNGLLAAGSLLMALAVGCRPNLLLYSFLALPLFWRFRKTDEAFGPKKRAFALAALLLPYVPVAAGLMAYNAVRFGSPVNFGFQYNLTVLDSTNVVSSGDLLVMGIYEYLFRPAQWDCVFPFIVEESPALRNPLGHSSFYYTWNYGGLFATNLLLWCLPGAWVERKKERSGLYLLIPAVLNLAVNLCMGGVAYHYRLDFAVFLLLAAGCAAAAIRDRLEGSEGERYFRGFLLLGLCLSFIFHGSFYWSGSLREGNTELYYRLYTMFR